MNDKQLLKIEKIGDRLKFLRVLFQLSQEQVAIGSLARLRQATITKIERNLYFPDDKIINKLSLFLRVNNSYLQFGTAPIFDKLRCVCGDFFIAVRNRKFQNILTENYMEAVINHLVFTEIIEHCMIITKQHFHFLVLFSELKYPHCLIIRTDSNQSAAMQSFLKKLKVKIDVSEMPSGKDILTLFYSKRVLNKEDIGEYYIPHQLSDPLNMPIEMLLTPFHFDSMSPAERILGFVDSISASKDDLRNALERYDSYFAFKS
jgi:transcriptional regulator with XRE-family HTH domain